MLITPGSARRQRHTFRRCRRRFALMDPFANMFDAGHQLGGAVRRFLFADPDDLTLVVAPLLPNGVPVYAGMRSALPEHMVSPLHADRSDGLMVVQPEHDAPFTGNRVVIVDDGVETGTAARAAHAVVHRFEPAELILAVPVCPRQTMAELALRFDDIIAVHAPLGRRDLRWHFTDFDTIDDDEARRMLTELT